jgi:hypothetical protein
LYRYSNQSHRFYEKPSLFQTSTLLGTGRRYSFRPSKLNDPFSASFTDFGFWKLWYDFTGSQRQLSINIDEMYGDTARLGVWARAGANVGTYGLDLHHRKEVLAKISIHPGQKDGKG